MRRNILTILRARSFRPSGRTIGSSNLLFQAVIGHRRATESRSESCREADTSRRRWPD
jgi:hypothetical protein